MTRLGRRICFAGALAGGLLLSLPGKGEGREIVESGLDRLRLR